MDLRITPEEEAFRQQVRAFIQASLPDDIRASMRQRRHLDKDQWVRWQRILNAKGWAVPAWPREHGGTGWTPVQRYIFLEELHQAPAPETLSMNTGMIGPVLIAFGNDEQKKRFLPRIANLDDWWCQGFSEPNAGSDLASLRTSAVRQGDHYLVNGQKAWTTLAHFANWMFCLARTDPAARKQAGISMLLIDMRSPGVTVRPIVTIDGAHETNEVFLENVKVPLENLVGQENHGWDYAKYLLGHERTGIARVGVSKERVRHIKALAAHVYADGRPLLEQPSFRERLTALEIELKALEITQMRVLSARTTHGDRPDPFSSILKIKGSELQQASSELLMELAGPAALPWCDTGHGLENGGGTPPEGIVPEWAAPIAPSYFFWRAFSIFGGSNEIQKNIMAKAVLEL